MNSAPKKKLSEVLAQPGSRLQAPHEETNLGAYWILDWPDGGYYVVSFSKSTGDYSAKKYMPGPKGEGEYVTEELGDERAKALAWFKGLYCEWRV
ncbi:hypothetical protein [Hyphomicrobium sp. DY-1]|uniref:hypothetical protein n=1 Tax=Hyphomicrobium sp. DY-1 TaxID=3075650 RepID=UPI0039C0D249